MLVLWLALQGLASGFCYDADSGGGGSSSDAIPPADSSKATETAPEEPKKGSRTFTQDEVSKLTAEEKRQGKKEGEQTAITTLLARLKKEGVEVENIDNIAALLVEDKKRRDAQLSETERLQKTLEKEQAEKQVALEALTKIEAQTRLDRRDTAVKAALNRAKVREEDVEDVLVLMEKRGLLTELLDKEGVVNSKAVEEAVTKFKKDKSNYFLPGGAGSRSNADGKIPSAKTNRERAVQREKRRNFD